MDIKALNGAEKMLIKRLVIARTAPQQDLEAIRKLNIEFENVRLNKPSETAGYFLNILAQRDIQQKTKQVRTIVSTIAKNENLENLKGQNLDYIVMSKNS